MKILICGKGGSGKSTVSTLVAKRLKDKGFRVLLVDADESNIGVSHLLGAPDALSLLDSLGGKKDLQKKMMEAFPKGKPLSLFGARWTFDDIPEDCLSRTNGIEFMAVGKIQHFGEGCACPMGALAKTFLSNLETADNQVVVVDAEAGVEHFGRGVEAGCDMIVVIVDPTYESFLLARKIKEMAKDAHAEVYFLLNKVDSQVRDAFKKHMDDERVIGEIPKDNAIFMSSLEGKPLTVEIPQLEKLIQLIERAQNQ